MSTLTSALSTALVDFLWQGALVGLALWAALAVLRGRSANARYAVSCAALAILTALPLLTIAALAWSVTPSAPASTDMTAASAPESMPQTLLQVWIVPETPRLAWLAVVQQWALPVWSAGVLLFSARLAWGWTSSFTL